METCADGKSDEKGKGSEGCVSDDNPACGEGEGGKLADSVVRHGRG